MFPRHMLAFFTLREPLLWNEFLPTPTVAVDEKREFFRAPDTFAQAADNLLGINNLQGNKFSNKSS